MRAKGVGAPGADVDDAARVPAPPPAAPVA